MLLALFAMLLMVAVAQVNASDTESQVAVSLPQGNNHVQPFADLRYLITDETVLDPEMAMSQSKKFERLQSAWVDFGKVEGSIWLLMRVTNETGRSGDWLIDIQRPFADALLVQKRAPGKAPETLLSVDSDTHFDDRPVISQYLVAPLRMEAGESAEILIGLRSSTGSWMPVTFVTPERMRTAHMQEGRTNWLINGAMLALVMIALIMGRLVGWPLVLAFASYVSLSALFVANNEGYLHRFVWPGSMWAYEPANLLLLAGMMIAILQFARLFAGFGERHLKANRAVIALLLALGVVAVLSLFFWQNDAMRYGLFVLVPLAALVYFIIAITAWRDKVLGALPFLAGSLAILLTVATIGAVLLAPGKFPMTVALDYFHGTVLFESMAFLLAILVRMLAVQAELNRSLQAEVASSQEKLKLAENLQKSRQRYDEARDRADGLRAKLASTSHDLQQPLISLRRGLADITQRDPASAASLQSALDYLEQLSETGLSQSAPDNPMAGEQPDAGVENFPISAVLANCEAMFSAEAQEKTIRLKVRPSLVVVRTEPIELMRAISNLVSNALKHSGANRLLLGVQERGDHVLLRVVDDGRGMSEQQLAAFGSAYTKGDDSEGHGLGLHLVKAYADNPGHAITTRSTPDRGTCITLTIPKGGSE
ncbi:MAG: sensor histidine kinase [Erythrobacter sp.]